MSIVARVTRSGRFRSLQRLRVEHGNGNRDRVLFVLSVAGGGWRSRPVRHGDDGATASSGEALDASFADELVERGGDGRVAQCGAFSDTYAFRTFSGSTVPFAVGNKFTSGNNDGLLGTASYEGRAAGQYVTKDFSGGVLSGGTAGAFTATASLTANFGVTILP